MSTPTEQLEADHRIIEKALRALAGLAQKLERGERMEPAAFERLFDFLANFADGHHHRKEERYLFPALGLHGVQRDRGPIGVMLQEHCTGRALIMHMRHAADAYTTGDPKAVGRFAEAANDYVDLLNEHIYKEDTVLFRIAESVLDERAMQALKDEFDQIEGASNGLRAKYQREAEEMEKAWAV